MLKYSNHAFLRYKKYIKVGYFYIFMEKVFILSIIVTCLFVIIKTLEMKFIDKEWKPLKLIIRDAVIVFVSAMVASFLYFHMDGSMTDFLNVVTDNKSFNMSSTQIFTDEPGF